LNCLSRDPLRGAKEILAECVQVTPARRRPATREAKQNQSAAFSEPSSYFYGGSFGIGLLTRDRMQSADVLRMPSTQHPRAVLYARIETPVVPELHVFCTHLTPLLRGVPYTGPGSWQSEQSRQVIAMLSFIEQKAGPNGAVVVLGDLNCGPATGAGVIARLPQHYERFIARGFRNPYVESRQARCTYCYDNPLIGSGGGGLLIDHILTRRIELRARAQRVLDAPLILDGAGRSVRTAYSDHYGLVLEVGQ
jgi:endonuclease/exonuclease/phosphatase family metal-dependent hydrolase